MKEYKKPEMEIDLFDGDSGIMLTQSYTSFADCDGIGPNHNLSDFNDYYIE